MEKYHSPYLLRSLTSQRECIITGKKKSSKTVICKHCTHQNRKLEGKALQNQGVIEILDSKEPKAVAQKSQFTYNFENTSPHLHLQTANRTRLLQHSLLQKIGFNRKDRFTMDGQKLINFFVCNPYDRNRREPLITIVGG